MQYQLIVYSTDAVFARMLELEFSAKGLTVYTAGQPRQDLTCDVALLDLDSVAAPSPETYQRLIGFTRGSAFTEDEVRRQCSLILHRPFDMALLRREVLREELYGAATYVGRSSLELSRTYVAHDVRLDREKSRIVIDGKEALLTPTELAVADILLHARGTLVTREALSAAIGESVANKTDVYVCFLRKKLEALTPIRLIQTVRGKGYLFIV